MAQASKAIIPKDTGGPFGQRIGVTVEGSLDWTLVVGAYQTERMKSTDWNRYSLVVLNWNDNSTGTWNPQPVEATIAFRGQQVCTRYLLSRTTPVHADRVYLQAKHTFPVGLTTLWWFAIPDSLASSEQTPAVQIPVDIPVAMQVHIQAWARSLLRKFL